MTEKEKSLAVYRYTEAKETLISATLCFDNKLYKDSINRSYYVVFYTVKAVLALNSVDFKRHKDAIAYFNQNYIATEIFPKELGKRIGRLKRKREASDYDDFYIASMEEAQEQIESAKYAIEKIGVYLAEKDIVSNL